MTETELTTIIKTGTTLSITQTDNHTFHNFLCNVKSMRNSTTYKNLKKLTCVRLHPMKKTFGSNMNIYFDPKHPDYGFLSQDAFLIPVKISKV